MMLKGLGEGGDGTDGVGIEHGFAGWGLHGEDDGHEFAAPAVFGEALVADEGFGVLGGDCLDRLPELHAAHGNGERDDDPQ